MYRQSNQTDAMRSAECPRCQSKRLMLKGGKLTCTNCDHVIGKTNEGRSNKYGAKRTEFNGKIFDSKFEASVAEDLETRKLAKDIKDYDTQFRIEVDVYNALGEVVAHKRHKVDFRILHNDGSYELLEAKGMITADYQWRRDIVVGIWLSEHKDYIYSVVKQGSRR